VCEQETFGEIDQLAYWAPAEAVRVEVDFLVRRGKELTAIEVKSSARLRNEDLLGLEAITPLPGLKRRILVYGGRERLRRDGVDVLPFGEFARELGERKL
jgi:predicted AAA+ superfamily ATPase